MVKIGQNGSFRVWTELFRVMRAPCHRPMTPNSKKSLKNEKNWFWSKLGQQPWLTIYGQNRSKWVISSLNWAFWAHESSPPSSDDAGSENHIKTGKKLVFGHFGSTHSVSNEQKSRLFISTFFGIKKCSASLKSTWNIEFVVPDVNLMVYISWLQMGDFSRFQQLLHHKELSWAQNARFKLEMTHFDLFWP
jgi:hypothetical protein